MLYRHHHRPGDHDCGLGAQEGLGLVEAGCLAPYSPEPLPLQREGRGQCWWLQGRLGAGSLLFLFSSGHLALPVGVEVPSHCHPPGPGLVFRDLFFFVRSISEIGRYLSVLVEEAAVPEAKERPGYQLGKATPGSVSGTRGCFLGLYSLPRLAPPCFLLP